MTDSLKAPLAVLARVLLALMFVQSGLSKLANPAATAGFMASGGLPATTLLAVAVGLFETLAGLALIAGYRARAVALALGVFTLIASVLFHAFWAAPADQQFMQQLLFMKNLAVAGGMFMIASLGAGSFSVDSLRLTARRRAA